MRDDLKHGLMRLRSRPGLMLAAALMLGLGIGLTTAMFTVVDALVLRPVPFHDAARLTRVDDVDQPRRPNHRGASRARGVARRSRVRRRRRGDDREVDRGNRRWSNREGQRAWSRPECSRCSARDRSAGARSTPPRDARGATIASCCRRTCGDRLSAAILIWSAGGSRSTAQRRSSSESCPANSVFPSGTRWCGKPLDFAAPPPAAGGRRCRRPSCGWRRAFLRKRRDADRDGRGAPPADATPSLRNMQATAASAGGRNPGVLRPARDPASGRRCRAGVPGVVRATRAACCWRG